MTGKSQMDVRAAQTEDAVQHSLEVLIFNALPRRHPVLLFVKVEDLDLMYVH